MLGFPVYIVNIIVCLSCWILFIFVAMHDALTLTHLPPGTQVDHSGETGVAQVTFAFVYLDDFWVFVFAAEDNISKQSRVVSL